MNRQEHPRDHFLNVTNRRLVIEMTNSLELRNGPTPHQIIFMMRVQANLKLPSFARQYRWPVDCIQALQPDGN